MGEKAQPREFIKAIEIIAPLKKDSVGRPIGQVAAGINLAAELTRAKSEQNTIQAQK